MKLEKTNGILKTTFVLIGPYLIIALRNDNHNCHENYYHSNIPIKCFVSYSLLKYICLWIIYPFLLPVI